MQSEHLFVARLIISLVQTPTHTHTHTQQNSLWDKAAAGSLHFPNVLGVPGLL